MAYLLDSDWTIDHLNDDFAAVRLLQSLASEPMYISIVTYMEAFQGTLRKADPAGAVARLRDFVVMTASCTLMRPSLSDVRVSGNQCAAAGFALIDEHTT